MKSPMWTILIGLTVLGYFATDSLAHGRRRSSGCAPSCCSAPSCSAATGVAMMVETRLTAPVACTVNESDANNIKVASGQKPGVLGQCMCGDSGYCYVSNGKDMWMIIKKDAFTYLSCGSEGHVVKYNEIHYVVSCK